MVDAIDALRRYDPVATAWAACEALDALGGDELVRVHSERIRGALAQSLPHGGRDPVFVGASGSFADALATCAAVDLMARCGAPAGVDVAAVRRACGRQARALRDARGRVAWAAALEALDTRFDVAADPLGWCLQARLHLALLAFVLVWGFAVGAVRK